MARLSLEPGRTTIIFVKVHYLQLEDVAYLNLLLDEVKQLPTCRLVIGVMLDEADDSQLKSSGWSVVPVRQYLQARGAELALWSPRQCQNALAIRDPEVSWCPIFLWLAQTAASGAAADVRSVWLVEGDVRCTGLGRLLERTELGAEAVGDWFDLLMPAEGAATDLHDHVCNGPEEVAQEGAIGAPPGAQQVAGDCAEFRAHVSRPELMPNLNEKMGRPTAEALRRYRMRWAYMPLVRLSWYALVLFGRAMCAGWSGYCEVLYPTLCNLDRFHFQPPGAVLAAVGASGAGGGNGSAHHHHRAGTLGTTHAPCSRGDFREAGLPASWFHLALGRKDAASRWRHHLNRSALLSAQPGRTRPSREASEAVLCVHPVKPEWMRSDAEFEAAQKAEEEEWVVAEAQQSAGAAPRRAR